jgi:hypothetical protein
LTFVPNENCERNKLQWILPYLQPEHAGWSIAAEAAEAFYRSEHRFRIDAGLLLGFLAKCPSSQGVRPGSLIRKILLNIDEDAHLSAKDETSKAYGGLIGSFLIKESRNINGSQEELSGMCLYESAGRPS